MDVAIGFKESLRIYTIIEDGLKFSNFSLAAKNCEATSYSKYGKYLAFANGFQINLINSYTYELKRIISFHPHNSIIK